MELTFPETALHEVQTWTAGVWSHNMTPSDLQSHIFRKKNMDLRLSYTSLHPSVLMSS